MSKAYKNLWAFLFLLVSITIHAQEKVVTGLVTDDSGPLPGVAVLVKGTTSGTETDFDGRYSIRVQKGAVLTFSFVGMKTVDITVGDSNTINVQMQEESSLLEEVVVVAYGTTTKEALTGAVTQIKAEALENRPVANISAALEGASPGIQVTASGGQPGSGQAIRIRGFGSVNGTNEPLYVVDGVPITGQLNNINAADIENISILKDASSTALYGSRAANGVVLVTTKSGKSERGELNVNIATGITERAIREYDRVDAFQYYPLMWEALRNSRAIPGVDTAADVAAANSLTSSGGSDGIFSRLGYNPFNVPNDAIVIDGGLNPNASLLYDDFDWEGAITQVGIRRNIDLNYSGRTDKADYYASLGYLDETGYLTQTDFLRLTGRLNINYQAKEWLKVGANLATTISETNNSNIGETNSFRNPFRFTRQMGPIYPIFAHDPVTGDFILDANGDRIFDLDDNRPSGASTGRHIVAERELDINLDQTSLINFRGYADVKLLDGLNFKSTLSYEEQNLYNNFFYNTLIGDGAPDGLGFKQFIRRRIIGYTQLLTYTKTFDDHSIEILGGHESQETLIDDFNGTRRNQIVSDNIELINFVQTTDLESIRDEESIESYLSRFNYNYASKYFLSASIRADGSSRFASDNRWGTFWSLGGSWSIDKESFLTDVSWVDFLKFRSSYGELGNNRGIGFYPYLPTFSLGVNNGNEPGIIRNSLGADDLVWEKSKNFDVALEFGIFNRLTGIIEFYNRESSNLLFDVPVAPTDGVLEKDVNIGTLFNRGLEMSLSYDVIKNENFKWNLTVNATTLKNEFTELPQEEIIVGTKRYRVGASLFDYWLRDWYGVDPADGSGLFVAEDPNASGVRTINGVAVTPNSNNAKFHIAGSVIPDLFGSIVSDFRYKGLSLNTVFTYQIGGDNLDFNYRDIMSAGTFGTALHTDILNRWQQPGDITDIPRLDSSFANEWDVTSDRWLVDASFFNLRQVNLSYDFNSDFLSRINLAGLRVFASAENVFTINARRGLNVQQQFNGNTSNAFTPARIISVGLNIKL